MRTTCHQYSIKNNVVDGQVDKKMDRNIDRQIYRWIDLISHVCRSYIYGQIDKQIDGNIDGQVDIQMGSQIDGWIETYILHIYLDTTLFIVLYRKQVVLRELLSVHWTKWCCIMRTTCLRYIFKNNVVYGQVDKQMQMYRSYIVSYYVDLICRWIDIHYTSRQMEIQMDRQTSKQIEIQMDTQMENQIDGKVDGWIETYIHSRCSFSVLLG